MSKKILVIDDDVLVLKTMRRLLSMEGYEISECKDAVSALELVNKETFDLVITDIRMPGMDGIQMLEKMRSGQKNQGLPVILITGYASENAPIEAFRLDAVDYILKPFDNDQLLARITQIFEMPEKREGVKSSEGFVSEVKKIVDDFRAHNQQKIFKDVALTAFVEGLEKKIFEMEKFSLQRNLKEN